MKYALIFQILSQSEWKYASHNWLACYFQHQWNILKEDLLHPMNVKEPDRQGLIFWEVISEASTCIRESM